jgi:hypothetical protein
VPATRTIVAVILLGLLGTGCGGGSSSGGGGGGSMNDITWPTRDGGMTTELPPAIMTGRVFFSSATGEQCCVAVDPSLLSGSAQRGLAILNDLPPGPATVTVAGFTTDFAPTIPGVTTTCSTTVPQNAAKACDQTLVAAPAFESPPLSVTIVAGAQTNVGDVPMDAFPFLFDFSPAQGASAPAPVQFALTVVDAVTNIQRDSVALEVSFDVPDPQGGSGSPFRRLTKRVTLELNACEDGSNQPCSPQGNLDLAGFAATGTAPELPEGEVEARVTAENLGDPPRALDFRYPFFVLATPTATATATPTGDAAAQADATAHGDAAEKAAALGDSGTAGETPAPTLPRRAAAQSERNPPTPTATPKPGGDNE